MNFLLAMFKRREYLSPVPGELLGSPDGPGREMMMTEAELSKFLEANKADILEATRQSVIARVTDNLRWTLPETFNKTVSEFLAAEIAPEIVKELTSQKGAIVASVVKAAATIGDEIAKQMVLNATKALTSYSGRDILTKLVTP